MTDFNMSNQNSPSQFVAANLGTRSPKPGVKVTLELIAALKREIDFCLQVDLQQAANLADVTYKISLDSDLPLARALGIRVKAQSLHASSRYAEAIEFYNQARDIYLEQKRPVEAARVARSMVDALMYQSKYEQALSIAAEARATFKAYGEIVLLAQLETNLGNIYHRLDRYQQALECYERAAEIFEAENNATALALVSYNAANIYSCLDDFRKAETLYKKSYELYAALGMELPATQSRYALGYLYFLIGDFHPAVRVLREVRVDLARLGKESWVALCDLDLAEIYLQLNVIGEAAEMATSAARAFALLGMNYEEAKALAFLGLAKFKLNKNSEAERLLRQAREQFKQEGNEVYCGLSDLYLADLALAGQQSTVALDLATSSEVIFCRGNLKAKRFYAQVVKAKALYQAGNVEEAKQLLLEVIEGNAAIEAPWLEYQARELFGDLLLEGNDPSGAFREYTLAVAVIERMRGSIRVDEYRSAFFKDKLRVFEKLIRLCLESESGLRREDAFYYLESCKARTLIDQVMGQLENRALDKGDVPEEFLTRWRQIREELNWFYYKVGRYEPPTEGRRLIASPGDWEEIRAREQELADVIREIQIHDPNFVWLRASTGIRVKDLQAMLGTDEVLVEYYFDSEDLRIFVVDHNGLRIENSPISRTELRTQVMKFQLQVGKFHYGAGYVEHYADRLLESANACLHELYEALIAPVRSLLRGRRLIFVPYDFLHNVPFHALFDGDQYLLDQYEIGYAPSAHLFTHFGSNFSPASEDVLIIGATSERTPRIKEEIQSIQRLYPNALCFSGDEATSTRLAEHSAGRKIVHIASHAVFRYDNPMFSAFQLADTWLSFYALSSLDLRGAMVTLSGCSTGANRIYAGDELIGMVRGFLSAGASSLVVSLWEVDDHATAQLMTAFYSQLQSGASPSRSLQTAARQVKEQLPHPYYWAPFLFMGGAEHPAPIPSSSPGNPVL